MNQMHPVFTNRESIINQQMYPEFTNWEFTNQESVTVTRWIYDLWKRPPSKSRICNSKSDWKWWLKTYFCEIFCLEDACLEEWDMRWVKKQESFSISFLANLQKSLFSWFFLFCLNLLLICSIWLESVFTKFLFSWFFCLNLLLACSVRLGGVKVVVNADNLLLQAVLHTNSMLHFIQLFHSLFASKPATEPAFAINH